METIELSNFSDLPYGENINQTAQISKIENGLEYKILSDNPIEYLDFLNFSRVVEILSEFFDVNACAVAKENQLFSAALGSSLENALEKAVDCDPINLVGSTVGFTKDVTEEVANQLIAMKIKNIISVRYDQKALEHLQKGGGINIIQIKSPLQELLGLNENDIKLTPFGYLVQNQNESKLTKSSFKVQTKTKPSQQQAEDAIFAWKIAKYTKSKSAVIAKDLAVKSIVQSYINNVDAVEKAMDMACENSKDAVIALDSAIENEETINACIQGRIGLIIESGDNENSAQFVKLCDKYNVALISTGIRNNRY